jgi:hypothetical protein
VSLFDIKLIERLKMGVCNCSRQEDNQILRSKMLKNNVENMGQYSCESSEENKNTQ